MDISNIKIVICILIPILGLIGTLLMTYSKDVKTNPAEPWKRFLSNFTPPTGDDIVTMRDHSHYYSHNKKMKIRRILGVILTILATVLGIIVAFLESFLSWFESISQKILSVLHSSWI